MTELQQLNHYEPELKFTTECCWNDHEFFQMICYERNVDEENGDETDELYVSIINSRYESLWDRLKAAWNIIIHGEHKNNGVMLKTKQLTDLRDYLDSVVDYWTKLKNKQYADEQPNDTNKVVKTTEV